MAHCKPRWFLAVLLPTRHISFFIYIDVSSPTRSVWLYQVSFRGFRMPFSSVSRSLWIQSRQEPLSLRSSSPCAWLFMQAGPKELYMQMLRDSCIPSLDCGHPQPGWAPCVVLAGGWGKWMFLTVKFSHPLLSVCLERRWLLSSWDTWPIGMDSYPNPHSKCSAKGRCYSPNLGLSKYHWWWDYGGIPIRTS